MTICGRKTGRSNQKPNLENQARSNRQDQQQQQQHQPPSDPNYDETQENIQTVELQEDPLANVRLLTPALPGGCNDENAAKEAAARHKTNQYFPKLEVQKRRILNNTRREELRKMVEELPPHPRPRLRTEIKTPSLTQRTKKWKDVHVHWHDVGLVYLIRSQDTCRSKDDGAADTVDSLSKEEPQEAQESTKINSEMPMSDKKAEKKGQATPRSNNSKEQNRTPGPPPASSKRDSLKERKLAKTQEETIKSDNGGTKTPHGVTPKPPGPSSSGVLSGPESVKSINL